MSWELTDHICQHCFGRVLVSASKSGADPVYRCSNCGARGSGTIESLCCCGMSTHEHARKGEVIRAAKSIGLRCTRNPNQTPSMPCEIIAVAGVSS